MDVYEIRWPDQFDEYSWEIESKGWFPDLEVEVNGRTIKLTFYDPVRLSQTVNDEIFHNGVFAVASLIVINRVCLEIMESTIAALAKSGQLGRLK